MKLFLFTICSIYLSWFVFPNQVFAITAPHQTVIINQIRGTECCDAGSTQNLTQQIENLEKHNLPATFVVRYDTLADQSFITILQNLNSTFEIGGFLEITPSLASNAQVTYQGNEESWYEAQNAYLIGYSQTDRQKIIDTYMTKFQEIFGYYPKTTTAWMIDAWSLQYLKQKYGVIVNQITREQIGTDSYSLYGGPPHYPYWPSHNWALMPTTASSGQMPLIVRQTITDPVQNYGDTTSSFTSQPNDYMLGDADINYFSYLFAQAHNQLDQSTFALLGLENSMPQEANQEFFKQLEIVSQWQQQPQNQVVTSQEYAQHFTSSYPQVYYGYTQNNQQDAAWWITTPNYRIRIRLSNQQLYISDLRVYSEQFEDPYFEQQAATFGWWISPFLIDGSRYFYQDSWLQFDGLAPDSLIHRKKQQPAPTRIVLLTKVKQPPQVNITHTQNGQKAITFTLDNQTIASFANTRFTIPQNEILLTNDLLATAVTHEQGHIKWINQDQQTLWELQPLQTNNQNQTITYQIQINQTDLRQERDTHYQLLFPELKHQDIDPDHSYVYYNNRYAIAGRNPVRLVYFPQDKNGNPSLIETYPQLQTNPEVATQTSKRQHGKNGMIFLDFENPQPLKTQATITHQNFTNQVWIYFAPNCKQQKLHCLTHPRQAYWYIRAIIEDKIRALIQKKHL